MKPGAPNNQTGQVLKWTLYAPAQRPTIWWWEYPRADGSNLSDYVRLDVMSDDELDELMVDLERRFKLLPPGSRKAASHFLEKWMRRCFMERAFRDQAKMGNPDA